MRTPTAAAAAALLCAHPAAAAAPPGPPELPTYILSASLSLPGREDVVASGAARAGTPVRLLLSDARARLRLASGPPSPDAIDLLAVVRRAPAGLALDVAATSRASGAVPPGRLRASHPPPPPAMLAVTVPIRLDVPARIDVPVPGGPPARVSITASLAR